MPILSQVDYEALKKVALQAIQEGRKVEVSDCLPNAFDYEACVSLQNQLLMRAVKSDSRRLDDRTISDIVTRVLVGGESLRLISNEIGLGSYKVAKVFIDKVYGKGQPIPLSSILENPSIITDPRVRADLVACIADDPICSPEINLIKESMGREYEALLIERLTAKNMCFETEAELRSRGKPKTPDILFLLPMATKTTLWKTPVVINWIDSKAMFADEETFTEHLEQLKGYANRYGRGMVIYWHGFVESIISIADDDSVVITDMFPDEWIFPLPLDASSSSSSSLSEGANSATGAGSAAAAAEEEAESMGKYFYCCVF